MNPLAPFKSRKPLVLVGMMLDKLLHSRLKNFDNISNLFLGKKGIEIGGPSRFFEDIGYLPVYALARGVDGCNFSSETVWEGHLSEGENYLYTQGKKGYQYICEGAEVAVIPKNSYDFLLSCNNLEHIANPLKAVNNWLNLLHEEGVIVLVLPRKSSNFDHKRQVTKFEHLLDDYKNDITENDLSHVDEILKFHDLKLDPGGGSFKDFKKRSLENYSNRCLHHHVYDLELLEQICDYFKLKIVAKASITTNYIIIAKK